MMMEVLMQQKDKLVNEEEDKEVREVVERIKSRLKKVDENLVDLCLDCYELRKKVGDGKVSAYFQKLEEEAGVSWKELLDYSKVGEFLERYGNVISLEEAREIGFGKLRRLRQLNWDELSSKEEIRKILDEVKKMSIRQVIEFVARRKGGVLEKEGIREARIGFEEEGEGEAKKDGQEDRQVVDVWKKVAVGIVSSGKKEEEEVKDKEKVKKKEDGHFIEVKLMFKEDVYKGVLMAAVDLVRKFLGEGLSVEGAIIFICLDFLARNPIDGKFPKEFEEFLQKHLKLMSIT